MEPMTRRHVGPAMNARLLISRLRRFGRGRAGSIAVEWVVLSAAMIGLGVAMLAGL